MLQIVQDVKSGTTSLQVVPPPSLQPGFVRVRTGASLVSAGTERSLIELSKKGYLGKARARPDLVRQVLSKARKEGLWNTWKNVQAKLETPLPLGYSAAGIVEAVTPDVHGIQPGDRVAIAGAGYANHAELNAVPKNLVAVVPEGVSFEEACYATVAAIGLQGVRLARPALGESVVVIGLGLIGQITVQLLKAHGCRVLGVDIEADKTRLAKKLGADEVVVGGVERAVENFTRGYGADAVLVTAATESNAPIKQAGAVARRKGRIVVVGVVGMDVPRDVYYHKELELHVSMSYGPGRYDPSYEEGGVDYPYEYVRWTEQRNLEAILGLMADGRLDVGSLTTHRFPIDRGLEAYELVEKRDDACVGIVLTYDLDQPQQPVVRFDQGASRGRSQPLDDRMGIAFVGAGNYATLHLLPHVRDQEEVRLTGLMTATGANARRQAETFGFDFATTDLDLILEDQHTHVVFVATRHSTHANLAVRALEAGKHVFVEKPMVIDEKELQEIVEAYERANRQRPTGLMVGLNRRFAPMMVSLRQALEGSGPKQLMYRVNSGPVSASSWHHREEEGGGMLVGEMCHFIDIVRYLTGQRATDVYCRSLRLDTDAVFDSDNVVIVLTFEGGSVGTVSYSTVGDKTASKERLEVYGGGMAAMLDDFRRLEIVRDGTRSKERSWNQNKGQADQVKATLDAFRAHGQAPIPFEELVEVMRAIFAARRSLATGGPEALYPRGRDGS